MSVAGCGAHVKNLGEHDVGRTPSSAPDPLVRRFRCSGRLTRGSTAGRGARPTKKV